MAGLTVCCLPPAIQNKQSKEWNGSKLHNIRQSNWPFKNETDQFDGKRYKQIDNGEFVGLQQRTGLLAIYDDASNKRIAIVSIYEEKREGMYEPALQDVFFIRFELTEKKRELHIENERHKHFIYSIDDGGVRVGQ